MSSNTNESFTMRKLVSSGGSAVDKVLNPSDVEDFIMSSSGKIYKGKPNAKDSKIRYIFVRDDFDFIGSDEVMAKYEQTPTFTYNKGGPLPDIFRESAPKTRHSTGFNDDAIVSMLEDLKKAASVSEYAKDVLRTMSFENWIVDLASQKFSEEKKNQKTPTFAVSKKDGGGQKDRSTILREHEEYLKTSPATGKILLYNESAKKSNWKHTNTVPNNYTRTTEEGVTFYVKK